MAAALPLVTSVIEEAIGVALGVVERYTGVNIAQIMLPILTPILQRALWFYKAYPDVSSVLLTVLVIYILSSVSFAWYWHKTKFTGKALLYMASTNDATGLKKFKDFPPSPPRKQKNSNGAGGNGASSGSKKIKVVFIRHGESAWNQIFNKGFVLFRPFKLVKALITESIWYSGVRGDSLFYDSPLNKKGIQQAEELGDALQAKLQNKAASNIGTEMTAILGGCELLSENTVFVTSPLRRWISTLLLGFRFFFINAKPALEQVRIWTCLQEISRNVDTQSLTPAGKKPTPAATLKKHNQEVASWYSLLNISEYEGNKTWKKKGLMRIKEFAKKAFEVREKKLAKASSNSNDDDVVIIVAGHSLFYKHFFNVFLPAQSEIEAGDATYGQDAYSEMTKTLCKLSRTKKVKNGGMVCFDLEEFEKDGFRILPESVKEIHLGFEGKKPSYAKVQPE